MRSLRLEGVYLISSLLRFSVFCRYPLLWSTISLAWYVPLSLSRSSANQRQSQEKQRANPQCILRFLAGFIGSPPLATGGASLQDVFHPRKLPYAMGLYGLAAASGPAIAPVVSGYAVVANGWRWAYWEMLWLSGFSLLLLGFTMPEVRSFLPFFTSFQSCFLPIIAVL